MFTLQQIVPWGRSFREYQGMFALTEDDLRLRILGCGDGPAAFNAEATRRGTSVVSCDPVYQFSTDEIRQRIDSCYGEVLEQTRINRGSFVWDEITSLEELGRVRMEAMETFLADYEVGRRERRYVAASLPELPFPDLAFDLAISSHLLFLYTTHLSEEFHQQSISELCRVAREVRIFPLITLAGPRSSYVEGILHTLQSSGLDARIENVRYEFQRGGNQMLRIWRTTDSD